MKSSRTRFAETTSSIGAGVLGIGLGVVFAGFLDRAGMAFLVLGLLMHTWGMYDMRRLEKGAGEKRPGWSLALYWICWIALIVLASRILVNLIRG